MSWWSKILGVENSGVINNLNWMEVESLTKMIMKFKYFLSSLPEFRKISHYEFVEIFEIKIYAFAKGHLFKMGIKLCKGIM